MPFSTVLPMGPVRTGAHAAGGISTMEKSKLAVRIEASVGKLGESTQHSGTQAHELKWAHGAILYQKALGQLQQQKTGPI